MDNMELDTYVDEGYDADMDCDEDFEYNILEIAMMYLDI